MISINEAYKIGPFNNLMQTPRDVKVTKTMVVNSLGKESSPTIVNIQIAVFSDLSIITIQKRRIFKEKFKIL